MPRPIRTHTFRGHRWRVVDNVDLEQGMFGECVEGPCLDLRYIAIPIDGDQLHELDTVIHEALHACTELDECAVEESATDIARLLWRLGWRKVDAE